MNIFKMYINLFIRWAYKQLKNLFQLLSYFQYTTDYQQVTLNACVNVEKGQVMIIYTFTIASMFLLTILTNIAWHTNNLLLHKLEI